MGVPSAVRPRSSRDEAMGHRVWSQLLEVVEISQAFRGR